MESSTALIRKRFVCFQSYEWLGSNFKNNSHFFLLNSSLEAKADFLRIIRQTVKESSKKVQFPAVKAPAKGKYIPLGGKKLEGLPTNPRNPGKKRNGKDPQQPERHSMNLEENVHSLEYDNTFRTRSKTIGDLNNEVEEEETLASPFMTGSDLQMVPFMTGSEPQITQTRASPSSSTSNLSGSSHGSAKLLHASANPTSFSAPVPNKNADGSPIWKPRDDSPSLPSPTYENPPPMSQGPVNSRASVYGDCSEIVYRNDNATLFFNDPSTQAQSTFKDTECWVWCEMVNMFTAVFTVARFTAGISVKLSTVAIWIS